MTNDPLKAIGRCIDDKYLVEQFVAEGGFSYVYKARHKTWKQAVALKLLKSVAGATEEQRDELLREFVQEGSILREMSSRTACILQAHDVGGFSADDGQWYPFLVLEWLDGETLESVLERQVKGDAARWSLIDCMTLLEPAARALAVVHQRGVAHRDLKPANLFIIGEVGGKDAFVKILDFGIAKVIQNTGATRAETKSGAGVTSFTPAYGAPEQFSRATYGVTGPWTDVFAFALILVEMLTLAAPLSGDDIAQLAHASTDPTRRPTPNQNGANVSAAVEAVFSKALALHPKDRFASMGDFWSALRQASGLSIAPRGATPAIANTPQALAATLPRIGDGVRSARVLFPAMLVIAGLGAAWWVRSSGKPTAPANAPSSMSFSLASPTTLSRAPDAQRACPERMVKIDGGPFFMGYEGDGALEFEKPVHAVSLSPFCIDRTEVTVAMYKSCSDAGRCPRAGSTVDWPSISAREKKVYSALCNEGIAERGDHPINCVTWEMAKAYCGSIEGRLPTSAEWEFAVRGPDGRVYPWGDDPPDRLRLNACGTECTRWGAAHGETFDVMHREDDGYATTSPVGSFPLGRSRYGLDDVIGNVMEWVADWDGPYQRTEEAVHDPRGPENGSERVIRGGAWNASDRAWVRPSFRFHFPSETRSHAVGLRCASTPK